MTERRVGTGDFDDEPEFGPPTDDDFSFEDEIEELDPMEPNANDVARLDNILKLARRVIADSKVVDPIEPVLLSALLPHLEGEPGVPIVGGSLRPALVHAIAMTRNARITKGLRLRAVEGSADKQLRRLFPLDYPARGDDPVFYEESDAINQIDGEELWWDNRSPLRYNDPNTYKVITALINRLADRWGGSPTVVDVGTAFGMGAKKIMHHDRYPFKSTATFTTLPNNLLRYDLALEQLLDESVSAPSAAQVIGIDLLHPNADEFELGSSQTFLMSRRSIDPAAVKEFEELYKEPVARELGEGRGVIIPKLPIDATDADSLLRLKDFMPNGKADVFVFSGVFLQFPPEQQLQIFKNYQAIANPGAIAIVNEWAEVTPNGLKMLKGAHWHHTNGFKTIIVDLFDLDKPPIEICRYTNRQCERVIFTSEGRKILGTGRLD